MRDFLKYSNEIAHYHQANALAKSASELWFMLIGESKAGFDFEWNGEGLIKANFSCPVEKNEKEECWLPRSFSLKINGLKDQISTTLKAGQSLTLPRFYHKASDFKLTNVNPRSTTPKLKNADKDLKITIIKESGWETQVLNLEDSNDQWADNTYYILSNLSDTNAKTVEVEWWENSRLFDWHFTMKVEGKYGDKVVSKEYQLNQALPDFLQSDNYLK